MYRTGRVSLTFLGTKKRTGCYALRQLSSSCALDWGENHGKENIDVLDEVEEVIPSPVLRRGRIVGKVRLDFEGVSGVNTSDGLGSLTLDMRSEDQFRVGPVLLDDGY